MMKQKTKVEYGGGGRNRTGVHGFAGRCITTLPRRLDQETKKAAFGAAWKIGAGNGIRTRDPNLGKVVLYQLSYSRDERSVILIPYDSLSRDSSRFFRATPFTNRLRQATGAHIG